MSCCAGLVFVPHAPMKLVGFVYVILDARRSSIILCASAPQGSAATLCQGSAGAVAAADDAAIGRFSSWASPVGSKEAKLELNVTVCSCLNTTRKASAGVSFRVVSSQGNGGGSVVPFRGGGAGGGMRVMKPPNPPPVPPLPLAPPLGPLCPALGHFARKCSSELQMLHVIILPSLPLGLRFRPWPLPEDFPRSPLPLPLR